MLFGYKVQCKRAIMTHLKVAVRIRPLSSAREIDTESIVRVGSGTTLEITNKKIPEQNAGDSRQRIRRFTFDFCFQPDSMQNDIYLSIEPIIADAVKRRINSCILAYGQSASGKTHTMMGFPHDPGLIPRLCSSIFDHIRHSSVQTDEDYDAPKISVSYLEIYNEKVCDLLSFPKSATNSPLKVRQHPKRGPYVQGLTELAVFEPDKLLEILKEGTLHRRTGATTINPKSSRSHSVFIITFGGGAKLTLVDLAGSERAGSRCCTRFREGANINKSLVALGNVISALAEDSNRPTHRRFIPYRDSILTWLLKDTLGGSSDTIMIATISPSSACYNETVNTLRFGQRAKLIISQPFLHEDAKEKTIRELRAEILRLRELLNCPTIEKPLNQSMAENSSNPPTKKVDPKIIISEKLIPVVKPRQGAPLRRTASVVGASPLLITSKKAISDELLNKKLRKNSLEVKSKGVLTEPSKIEAKVDSGRRNSIVTKPRSQIVAAVTHRLYAKTKKKEIGVDTSDLAVESATPPKELTICSNARLKLKELTKRALKAHRNRNVETQTDLFPVLRIKEVATDSSDLKLELKEVTSVETNTETTHFMDKSINCSLLNSFSNDLAKVLTLSRSCSTQCEQHNPISFTRYLNPANQAPIFTNSVNISIQHNYQRGESISDDSLDAETCNDHLPTPDLLSNHNSLENQICSKNQLKHGIYTPIFDDFSTCDQILPSNILNFQIGKPKLIPDLQNIDKIEILSTLAPQSCILNQEEETDSIFVLEPNLPDLVKAKLIEPCFYNDSADFLTIIEPIVLKSIMKGFPNKSEPETSESELDLPDSLEYHLANTAKKVHFKQKPNKNIRMYKAMSDFLEQATILMSNLSQIQEFDVQVTVNDISNIESVLNSNKCHLINAKTQTVNINDSCVQTELDITNKYELLLEDSCSRLETKLNHLDDNDLMYNPWSLTVGRDYSSLESGGFSNSDYGSLPRQRCARKATPSAFLRQLTSLRQQIVNASREELES